jgi:mono/diheme cytochrome c family protein
MVKHITALTSLLGVAIVAGAGAATPPSLYTSSQATAGATVYAQNCATCHGAQLQGQAAPALLGQSFAAPTNHYTVGVIFSEIAEQMPAGEPGSLSHTEYENVMAYILSKNGYPAGGSALNYNASLGSSVPLVSEVK